MTKPAAAGADIGDGFGGAGGLALKASIRQDRLAVSEELTASELELLRVVLQRFTERHLDQFENLRFDTSYGPVFVLMTRELPPAAPPHPR